MAGTHPGPARVARFSFPAMRAALRCRGTATIWAARPRKTSCRRPPRQIPHWADAKCLRARFPARRRQATKNRGPDHRKIGNVHSIPLVTSIPSSMSRPTDDGRDLGSEYLLRCVESWKRSGFAPMSVNSRRELGTRAQIAGGVVQVAVDDDAFDITGKPHIFLGDLLRAARAAADGPVVLANADILLEPRSPPLDRVRELQPGDLLLAKRVDIRSPDDREGAEYAYGFDFFALHSSDLADQCESRLVFGAPWWDHYLPLRMFARRSSLVFLPHPFAFHLIHTERWSWDLWQAMGERFLVEMTAALRARGDGTDDLLPQYAHLLDDAVKEAGGHRLSDSSSTLGRHAPARAKQEVLQILHRVSQANLRILDELRARKLSGSALP